MNATSTRIVAFTLVGLLLGVRAELNAELIDFEDWQLETASDWRGPVDEEVGVEQPGPFGGTDRIGTVRSGSVDFVNRFNLLFGNWSGFAISNQTDVTTPGWTNQTSAYAGSGAGEGDDNYAIGFGYVDQLDPHDIEQLSSLPYFDIEDSLQISSLMVTNTTYAALSMLQGDQFTDPFGGATGSDPDFFRLNVYGVDAAGVLVPDSVEMMLADYRFEDSGQDFLIDTWTNLDLSPLAAARRLYFNLDSSDSNAAGSTTPAYFAVDNIVLKPRIQADVNQDGDVTAHDADLLCDGLAMGANDSQLDLDGDGLVSDFDLQVLLASASIVAGDTDFSGAVEFADFLVLSKHFGGPGSWSEGDFDCNSRVEFGDFLVLSNAFGGQAGGVVYVPEPSSFSCMLLGIVFVLAPRKCANWLARCAVALDSGGKTHTT